MHAHIICLGKLKETYWREAEAEYIKRLRPLTRLDIYELKEEAFTEKDTRERIKAKEAEKITGILERFPHAFIIALDERGKEYSSTDFSRTLQEWGRDYADIVFIMGGPLGLDAGILHKARAKMALSRFTFTHQMARVILIEQLYRAAMIAAGRSYHY